MVLNPNLKTKMIVYSGLPPCGIYPPNFDDSEPAPEASPETEPESQPDTEPEQGS